MVWYFRYHIRKILRAYMKPIPEKKASKWLMITRFAYFFLCWNALIITYVLYKKSDNSLLKNVDETNAHYFARRFGAEKAVIIGLDSSGITKYDFNGEKYANNFQKKYQEARKLHIANEII